MKTKIASILLTLVLVCGLMGCGLTAPEAPMEATIDGYTVVLGETTVQDIVDQGYEIYLESVQDVARDGDKYISFYYSFAKEAGNQFWGYVAVPWNGSTNINKEMELSMTEGILKSVSFSKSSTEKVTASYNGVDIQDMIFDYASEEWKAKTDDTTTSVAYIAQVKNGVLRFKEGATSGGELDSFSVQMSEKTFEKMQNQ